jgi:hypothetical protein
MKKSVYIDPIIEELRRYRQAIAAKFNYDIDAIADDAQRRQKTSGHRLLQPPKRKALRRRNRTSSAPVG